MERASSEVIAVLLNGTGLPSRRRRGRASTEASRQAAKRVHPRCQCGSCRQCLDDAKWERIFAEKFADPTYYTRLVVRAASPLASI
jgi:hypothetical protein